MLISIEGEEATGKTTLAYTLPKPLVGFSFDMGADRALLGGKWQELFSQYSMISVPYKEGNLPRAEWDGFDITVYELPPPIVLDTSRVTGHRELWDYFLMLIALALRSDYIRSIVIDTMTLARRVRTSAHLQDLQKDAFGVDGKPKPGVQPRRQLLQVEYGIPNDAIRDIYSASKGTKKNLAAIHHLTDEYVPMFKDGVATTGPSGKKILEGLSNTYRFVDMALRLTKRPGPPVSIIANTIKVGYDINLEGVPIENPTWDSLVSFLRTTVGDRVEF